MEDSSKNNPKINEVNEPESVYETSPNLSTEEELHPILIKLLEKAMQESEDGLGIPHEEVMKMVKEKYPFLNGI